MWSWRARPFETYHGPLALAEYIQDLLREDPSDLDRIYELPSPDTDELVWQYEHLRQFVIEFNLLLVALTGTCTPETCPKMTASNDWQYLCAAHRKPQECAAIDYMTHTIDGSTALLTVACPFSSRSQETAMLPVPPFPAALPPAHDSDAPRAPDSGAPSDLVTNLPSDGWISHTGPRGRTSWHHKSLGPAPWGNRPEDYSTPASALSVADTTTLSPPRGPRRETGQVKGASRALASRVDTNPFSDDARQDPVEMGTQGSQTCEASPDVAHLSPLSFGGVDRRSTAATLVGADSSMSLPRDKETLSTEFTPSSTPQVAPTRIPECSDTPSTSSRLLGASPAVVKKMPPDGDRGREFHAESGKATAGTPSTGLRAGCLRAEVHRLTTGVQGWKRHDCRSLLVTGSQLLVDARDTSTLEFLLVCHSCHWLKTFDLDWTVEGSVDQVKTVVDVGAGEVERCCLVGPGIMSLEVHRKKRRSSSLGRFTSPHRGGGSRSDAREQKLYFFEFDHAAAAQEFCDALASSQFSTDWLFAPRSNGAAPQSTAMEVVNEHDRLYLASHKQCVNASLRDVGFSTVRCNLCNGEIKAGFFVVVMQCKHTFHKECFHNHFSVADIAQDNPQEPDGIRTGNQVPPFQSDLSNPDCPTPEDAVAVVAPVTTMRRALLCPHPSCGSSLKVKLDGGGIADFTKTPDGLRILDLAPGKGDECCAQDDIVVARGSVSLLAAMVLAKGEGDIVIVRIAGTAIASSRGHWRSTLHLFVNALAKCADDSKPLSGPVLPASLALLRQLRTEEIYGALYADGLHAWTGAKVTLWTSCPQFVVLGPLYHMLNSACGAVYAVVLAALAETLLTMLGCTKWRYGPQTVNARMAFNAGHGSMDVGNVFSLFGPGVIFLFLRNCLAMSGIRILSDPVQSGLHRSLARANIRAPHPDLMTFIGDFLASILTAVLSAPLNQLYNYAVISQFYAEAGPLQKLILAWQFLEKTYLVWDASGNLVGLSRTFTRDLVMRCAYLATLMSLFGAVERVAVLLGRWAKARWLELRQRLPSTRSELEDRNEVDWSLRRSNGYFVDASFSFDPGRGIDEKFGVGSPELRFSPIGDKGDKVIEGIKKALIGMRAAGSSFRSGSGFVSDDLAPKPNDWGRQRQIDRFKKKDWVIELRLKALRK
eukprot:s8_g30.t3